MYIPPRYYTAERKEADKAILRVYYTVCEDLGISETEKMQKIFKFMMKYLGKPKFFEESQILDRYLRKLLDPSIVFHEPDTNDGNNLYYNMY